MKVQLALMRDGNGEDEDCALKILCGCGALDGTEISEAISTAIHLRQKGMKPLFYAPDVPICGPVNHLTKEIDDNDSSRNALVEAARLARSCIKPLCECEACTHGALILPGGFGAARTMSDFASKGANCTVLPDLAKLIEDFYCEKKPIGSMCIASAIVAKVLKGVKVTLGKESPKEKWPHGEVIKKVRDMGAKLEMKDVKGVTRCKKYNVFSTPAWLYTCATYFEIHEGIGKMIGMLKKCVKKL
ncbi:PREDICTED: ES1 protein homolog, mitochondrial-like [Dinoponera quadriceps]|uniref:ES1 protein homolog, mitochondrial-like n=1 Tax=Dinoponera quadriceps TaxID=609295 RepID=A0A6P3Y7E0_DINQU|nr:PREDICTED: ES1 protein homolog, mitochondrial-like [Dinoponera quadriceps]